MVRRIALARETVDLKQRDLDRKNTLVANRAGSQADLDNSMTLLVVAKTALEQLEQQAEAIRNQLLGDPNLPIEKYPPYAQAAAALDQAKRDLDHTVLRAPIAGMATQVASIQLGRYLTAGTPVFSLIDDTKPWIDANPKETDITHLQGRPAGRYLGRYVPGTQVPRRGRGGQPRNGRAVRDPAAAERERKLGQGRAARAGAHRIRAGRGCARPALRHERQRRYRHGPAEHRALLARPQQQGCGTAQMIGAAAALSPTARRALLTICAMTATIMQALDTTIANVALPYMQGSLSASLDQVSWVLTSYIVAAAVMTAPVGWLADRFGRKKLFIVCVGGFTVASLLCALAQNIEQIVAFRLMQGMCGAALVPLSQSVMLDAYPIEQRGQAMGIWGVGVMLGPIMGPTLGGWLTENYSWHWVFLVNIPVGIVTVFGLLVFMDETKRQAHLKFDWFGFLALAAGIGGMQLMLDRGEQLGWFGSPEIVAWLIISIVGFYYFFAHSLTTPEPFVRFAIFKDRNFLIGCFFMVIMGLMLFSSMALSAPFIQNVLGYPIEAAGWVLASRGLGTLVGMLLIGRLLRMFEARYLILIGLTLTALTMYQMTGFTADTSGRTIIIIGLVQGFGMGFVFIPLSTVAFLTLPPRYRTDGTSMLTLVRNVASSAGISVVIANLTNMTTTFRSQLVEHISPFNDALQHPDVSRWMDVATDQGRAIAEQMVTLQAAIMAYANDFMLLTVICALSIPFVFFIGSTASLRGGRVSVREHAPAME